MKTVYLNEDNTIREIIPEYALPPEKWYSEAFARRCVEVQDDVEQGWRYNPETGQAAPAAPRRGHHIGHAGRARGTTLYVGADR